MTTKLSEVVPFAAQYLESITGIHVPEYRLDVIDKALRDFGNGDPVAGLQALMSDDARAKAAILEVIAISETYFFRHCSHFDAIREYAQAAKAEGYGFHVLSAGCSTGEEAWSVAAVLDDVYGKGSTRAKREFTVSGWDLCPHRLDFAARGRYRAWSFRQGLNGYDNCFVQDNGAFEVAAHLRPHVRFSCVNLTRQTSLPQAKFDVILFRNVSIYWSAQQAIDTTAWLAERLRPGGVFIPGPSDQGFCQGEGWERISAGDYWAYRKAGFGGYRPAVKAVMRRFTEQGPAIPQTTRTSRQRTATAANSPVLRQTDTMPTASVTDSVQTPKGNEEETAALVSKVKQLADEGSADAALALLLKIKAPYPVEVRQLEGILLFSLGEYKAAAAAFRKCVYLEANNAVCRSWLALCLKEIGAYDRAERETLNAKHLQDSQ